MIFRRFRIVAVLLSCACCAASPRTITAEILVSIPWGDGPGRLSLRSGPERETLCVQTWALSPDGAFLLLDPVRHTVEEFGPRGDWIGTRCRNVRGTSLECDGDGTIWILDGDALRAISPDGRVQRRMRLPDPPPEGTGQGLRRSPRTDRIETVDRGRIRCAVPSPSNAIGKSPVEAVAMEPPRMKRAGSGFEWEGWGRRVSLGSGTGSVLPAGEDLRGHLYLEVERRNPDGSWRLEVHVVPEDPAERTSIVRAGPCDDISIVYRRILVAPDGTIYRLRTRPEAVEIHRFRAGRGEKRP